MDPLKPAPPRARVGRPAKFDRDAILDAAAAVVAEEPASGVTIAAIAKRSGAPTGSLYHRFASIDQLLAELWVRTVERFQAGFVEALAGEPPLEAAVAAALHTLRFSRAHLVEARLLLLHRREDLAAQWPAELGPVLTRHRERGVRALRSFTRRLRGRGSRVTRADVERVAFALIDVPYAAVRRHLLAGRPPPTSLDDLVEQTVRAALRAQ